MPTGSDFRVWQELESWLTAWPLPIGRQVMHPLVWSLAVTPGAEAAALALRCDLAGVAVDLFGLVRPQDTGYRGGGTGSSSLKWPGSSGAPAPAGRRAADPGGPGLVGQVCRPEPGPGPARGYRDLRRPRGFSPGSGPGDSGPGAGRPARHPGERRRLPGRLLRPHRPPVAESLRPQLGRSPRPRPKNFLRLRRIM